MTQTINVPLTTWTELKENNEKALTLIRTSRIPLSEAHSLINKQENELQELKSINSKQLQELMRAQKDLMKQQQSLSEMNNSLEMLSKDIKRNHQMERRLHRQRNTWALISGLLIVGLAIK
nr:MAG TPA: Synaptobrevin [Caudoviricetes sp.]